MALTFDGAFEGIIHLGAADSEPGAFEVCVLLASSKEAADRDFPAGHRLTYLPDLPHSDAIIVLRGVTDEWVHRHRITFSGADWVVKSGVHGPGPNLWSEENVRVDEAGVLHLSVVRREDKWECAEVYIDKPLGYGEYRWNISGQFSEFDPNVVVGLFLYEDQSREFDFELSKWGDVSRPNSQFVVQPASASRMHRFDMEGRSRISVSLDWHEGYVWCRCWDAESLDEDPFAEWMYTGNDVPKEGNLRPHINLWLLKGVPQSGTGDFHLSVESFAHSDKLDATHIAE
ncbi:MAG: hypothetical protein KDA96_12345 [Planctomycetaceae bacterium]|nr:hypothetical protein [Planctomycetaceae bacterium]